MSDNIEGVILEGVISDFKKRAKRFRIIANRVIIGAIIILIIAVGYLLYYSPQIAAFDIETHKKITEVTDDEVSKLSQMHLDLDKNLGAIVKKEKELDHISKVISLGGNYGLDLPDVKIYLGINNSHSSNLSNLNTSRLIKYQQKMTNLNEELKSEAGWIKFKEEQEVLLRKTENDLEQLQKRKKSVSLEYEEKIALTGDRYVQKELSNNRHNALVSIENEILIKKKEVLDLKAQIKGRGIERQFQEIKNRIIPINTESIEVINYALPKIRKKLEEYKKKEQQANKELNELKTNKARLEAAIQLSTPQKSNELRSERDSRLAFIISSNVVRIGSIIVAIFFSQIFLSIYRYTSRLASFYYARADVLTILTQSELSDKLKIHDLIETYSNVFTPDKVDFGKGPSTPIGEIAKLVSQNIK